MEMDKDLERESYKWANDVCSEIYSAQQNIGIGLSGETINLYNQLKWFGFFEMYDPNNNLETIRALALIKYRDLCWKKDHPPKPKMSKWERVTGRRPKR